MFLEFDSSITGQNFSSWFTGVSRSEEKNRINSKVWNKIN